VTSTKHACACALAGTLLTLDVAHAQETVDIGVLKDSDMQVVQKILFPKEGRLEVGAHLGWMAFDPLVTTPNAQISIDKHLSESLAVSVLVGGGYGFKTGRYTELESPAYGVSPAVYRYLASALVGVSWSPIYAKMNIGGTKVVHFDIYGTLRGGATLASSVIPGGGITASPTVSLGLGARFWVKENLAVRFGIRDDLMAEFRPITGSWHFKQNGGVTLGVTWFSPAKGARR
jgi:outer membrane beta-barrel protein